MRPKCLTFYQTYPLNLTLPRYKGHSSMACTTEINSVLYEWSGTLTSTSFFSFSNNYANACISKYLVLKEHNPYLLQWIDEVNSPNPNTNYNLMIKHIIVNNSMHSYPTCSPFSQHKHIGLYLAMPKICSDFTKDFDRREKQS